LSVAVNRARAGRFAVVTTTVEPVPPIPAPEPEPPPDVNRVEIHRWKPVYSLIPFNLTGNYKSPIPTIAQIKQMIRREYGVTPAELIGQRRTNHICRARQIAVYLALRITGHSLGIVGRHFGNRDHTTILHADRKFRALRESSPQVDAELSGLEDKLTRPAHETPAT